MISLIIADTDQEFAAEIETALNDLADIEISAVTNSLSHLLPLIEEHRPTVSLIGPNIKSQEISKFLHDKEHRLNKDPFVVFNTLGKAELATNGIKLEQLTPPLTKANLISAIQRAATGFSDINPEDTGKTKIVTIFSTKGGVGKTMIATNLAVWLAKNTDKRIAVVDLDLQFGDIGVMLKLDPEHTIYDCASISHQLNKDVMNRFLTKHESGVKALLAPLQPELADLIKGHHIKNIMEALRPCADIIIIDTPALFNDQVLTVLDETDLAILVATMDIPTIKNIRLCMHTLESLQYPDEMLALAINRADKNLGIKQHEIESALGKKALITIPNDIKVTLSINRAIPIVVDAPKSPAAVRLAQLATKLEDKFKVRQKVNAAA